MFGCILRHTRALVAGATIFLSCLRWSWRCLRCRKACSVAVRERVGTVGWRGRSIRTFRWCVLFLCALPPVCHSFRNTDQEESVYLKGVVRASCSCRPFEPTLAQQCGLSWMFHAWHCRHCLIVERIR